VLAILDQHLATSTFMAGAEFTLADIGYMPYVEYLYAAGESELVTSHKHLAAWWNRVAERPSWKKAIGKA